MELLQLRYFRTIAKFESVTLAAKHYNVPQPSMSQTLARLEHELGDVKLFDRRNNRLYLNNNGRLFLAHVEKALDEIDIGVNTLITKTDEIGGNINVLALENRRFIIGCISDFTKKYPGVSFSVSHDYFSGQNNSYDLCTSSQESYMEMHDCTPLIRERIILAVHEEHPLAAKESVSLSELRDEKFISMPRNSSLYNLTIRHCRENGFEPKIPFSCGDPYYVRKYISENMGIALAPSVSWQGRFRSNTKLIPLEDPEIITTSYLLWDSRLYLSPAVKMFRDFLIDKARHLEGNLI